MPYRLPVAVLALVSLPTVLGKGPIAYACSAVFVRAGSTWYFANNEDWHDPDSYLAFYPPAASEHGRVMFEFAWPVAGIPDYVTDFGGVNDQGLAFDEFATPKTPVLTTKGRPRFRNGEITQYCMKTCSTVEEVLDIYLAHDLSFMADGQSMFVDAGGDSAIIEGEAVVRGTGRYQICTNFLQSQYRDQPIDDARYLAIEDRIGGRASPTPRFLADVLSAVANRGTEYPTQYSYIYDTATGDLYLYYFHNYAESIVFNIRQELQKGPRRFYLPALFAYVTDARPTDGAILEGEPITFRWRGAPTDYTLSWSTDPSFADSDSVVVGPRSPARAGAVLVAAIATIGVVVGMMGRRRRWLMLAAAGLAIAACAGQPQRTPRETAMEFSYTARGFEAGQTYYWRLQAESTKGFVSTYDGGSFRMLERHR